MADSTWFGPQDIPREDELERELLALDIGKKDREFIRTKGKGFIMREHADNTNTNINTDGETGQERETHTERLEIRNELKHEQSCATPTNSAQS